MDAIDRNQRGLVLAAAILMTVTGWAATNAHTQDQGENLPQPPVLTPPPSQLPVPAPADAVVLFDGTDLSGWTRSRGGPAAWAVENGELVVVPEAGSIRSTETFGDVQLHIEWATPAVVEGSGQGRGNSGVFLMDKYEIQVLDSFENQTYPDGQAAAIYNQHPPLVNASRRPGEWQSYDIIFTAPHFDEAGELVSPARATVLHNGIVVQNDAVLTGATETGVYRAHSDSEPIRLQDHGNPVRFRNIWARRLQ